VVEEAEATAKPAKPTKIRRGGKKGSKATARKGSRSNKYAIDKNNAALQEKFGLTDREIEVLNSKPIFKLNDWELNDGTKAQLDEVADVLKAHPELKLEVGGHTCTIGTDAQNEIVGDRRSTAGLDYLISKGIAASRLTKQNYKSELPIADNETSAGRIKNRRISFKILD
jgi:outer membrane protein OmpA-like peptidoglycan-associated protein